MNPDFLRAARAGETVYINKVRERFFQLGAGQSDRIVLVTACMDGPGSRAWELRVPAPGSCKEEEKAFVREYLCAEIYNILSSIGGRRLEVFFDTKNQPLVDLVTGLDDAFCIRSCRKARSGYGRAVNVIDRMLAAIHPGDPGFRFSFHDLALLPSVEKPTGQRVDTVSFFRECTDGLAGTSYCGLDVGGTDIKAVLVVDGRIIAFKEYDWFPAQFTVSRQLIEPILLIVRLLCARLKMHQYEGSHESRNALLSILDMALARGAPDSAMEQALADLARAGLDGGGTLSGIGLCFPDVVVRNKIVGGEVYKTRGIRNNPEIEYEEDFARLTHLDSLLRPFVYSGGTVRIINDGPMAAFTAAVEMAAAGAGTEAANGVFAHTLGTELGTGWITEAGEIPDIPLEVYNFIIDLGSRPERGFEPDDLRSVNNFNTGLPGTLQKSCSQSGIFRLAMKHFPGERPDLFEELKTRGFVVSRTVNGTTGWYVSTEPVDQRKPFLEHMMLLPDREKDETNREIWRKLGEALAVTLLESKRILEPATDQRFLFGRLVKSQTCFDLIVEGARRIKPDIVLVPAGTDMAHTALMKQLKQDGHHTVAQFAQAIGAVYFANSGHGGKK